MPRFFYDPEENSGAVSTIVPVIMGGTGANNPDSASVNLGFVKADQVGIPNGIAQLDIDSKIPVDSLRFGNNALLKLDAAGLVPVAKLKTGADGVALLDETGVLPITNLRTGNNGVAILDAFGKVYTDTLRTGVGGVALLDDAGKVSMDQLHTSANGVPQLNNNGKLPVSYLIEGASGIGLLGTDGKFPMVLLNTGANGVASLDANSKIPVVQLNTAANGVAPLDANGKLATSYLYVGANGLGLLGADGKFPMSLLNTAANGVAGLDSNSKVLMSQLNTGANGLALLDASGKISAEQMPTTTTSIESALHLQSPRSITATGDIGWTVTFDGSANVSGNAVLSTTGITAGTYTKVTFDNKGRALAGGGLDAADIPTHTHNDYSSTTHTHALSALQGKLTLSQLDQSNATLDQVPTWNGSAYVPKSITLSGNIDTATRLQNTRTISAVGDIAWTVTFDGSANASGSATLANTGVTAGEYTKFVTDAKGRIVGASHLIASDIPAHTHTSYAAIDHVHSNYSLTDHVHAGYAPLSHTHTEYAATNHTHTGYATDTHTHSLSALTGVLAVSKLDTTNASDGQYLMYLATTGQYVPSTLPVANFTGTLNNDLTFTGNNRNINAPGGLAISGNNGVTKKTYASDGNIYNTNTGTTVLKEKWLPPSGALNSDVYAAMSCTTTGSAMNLSEYRSIWYDSTETQKGISFSSHPTLTSKLFKVCDDTYIRSQSHEPFYNNSYQSGTAQKGWSQIYTTNGVFQASDIRYKNVLGKAAGLDFIRALETIRYTMTESINDVVDTDEIESYKLVDEMVTVSHGIRPVVKEIDGRLVEVEEEVFTTEPMMETVDIYNLDGEVIRTEERQVVTKIPIYKKMLVPVQGIRVHHGLIAQQVKATADALGVEFAGWGLADKNDPESRQALRYEEFIGPIIQAVQEIDVNAKDVGDRLTAIEARLTMIENTLRINNIS